MARTQSDGYSWIWPRVVGPVSINQDTHSEMFDDVDHSYRETFVREALQNSLDAGLNSGKPVIVNFRFFDGSDKKNELLRQKFLVEAIDYRKDSGKDIPDSWESGNVSWLIVEDFNTTGLEGDFKDRNGSFWGYWLNFCISNKSSLAGRGSKGIGRVTFLIASEIQSVLGYTRRIDGSSAICGMALLGSRSSDGALRSPTWSSC